MNARWTILTAVIFGVSANGGDWPQWRGPNRDAKAADFKAPKEWPKELKQQWKVTVGDGVATPALVGDKLYVFSRESDNEIIRCLNADTGKELWAEKYPEKAVRPPAAKFSGPRSSPAVADGKVITLGAHGRLTCLDAASGKVIWKKDAIGGEPMFAISSSPLIADGLCIVQFGGKEVGGTSSVPGGIVAYEVTAGNEKWKWMGDSAAYASPVLATVDDKKVIVAETAASIVAVSFDGKLLWRSAIAGGKGGGGKGIGGKGPGGKGGGMGGMAYNAPTPVAEGTTIIYADGARTTKAVTVEKKGDELVAKDLWTNSDQSLKFNTPVVKGGLVFGITTNDKLFCVNAKTGKEEWSHALSGGGGRNSGYGSVVDAGSVLFALNPGGELIVFEPTDKEFKQIAKYKVGTDTFAYPVVAGNKIIIKDKDSVALYAVE
jgi:outer membrane protein assembly factor BamB